MRAMLAALWLIAVGGMAAPAAVAPRGAHVVVISIDGLRPVYYLPGPTSSVCPTLVALRERGSYAEAASSVYPSLTYPAHASIVTGVTPRRHGVTGNSVFAPLTEPEGRGFWYASDLQAPALWDTVCRAGGTVGAVSWPSSAGATSISWNLPEFWSSRYGHELSLVRRYASPDVLAPWEAATHSMTLRTLLDGGQRDAFVAACAGAIMREHQPTLLLLHLAESDHRQHALGPSAPEIATIMHRIDGLVSGVVEVVRQAGLYDQTTFVILGDHGFHDITSALTPNALLAQNGFITAQGGHVTDWSAMVLNSGGSAGVYINPQAPTGTLDAVHDLLQAHARDAQDRPLYSLIEKEALTQLGGPARAAFYLEAQPGYMFSLAWRGEALVRRASVKGNHGYLPTTPGMQTGFIVCGRGIKPGVVLKTMSLLDVAPTLSALLGQDMAHVDGHVLNQVLLPRDVRE